LANTGILTDPATDPGLPGAESGKPVPQALTEAERERMGLDAVYRAIEAGIRDVFPEAGAVPFMFTAGTDTKHYVDLCDAIYRFEPILQTPADLAGVHGPNERVSVENVRRCCMFYEGLIRGL